MFGRPGVYPFGNIIQRGPGRRGMALLVVMVLTMLIALGAYRYSFTMQAQYRLTRLYEEQVQARWAALSGLELAARLLEAGSLERDRLGGLQSNTALFQHVGLSGDQPTTQQAPATDQWYVSLLAPAAVDAEVFAASTTTTTAVTNGEAGPALNGLRFGLENESAKFHIPTLLQWDRKFPGHARATLMRLPQAAAGPVDEWLRRQGISSTGGAAGESRLLERLQDDTDTGSPQLPLHWFRWQWLGGDLNQNYRLDPLELLLAASLRDADSAGLASLSVTSANSSAAELIPPAAWQRYLTWYSGQRNESAAGQPRINLNHDNLLELHRQLLARWPAELANFVIAIRQYGPHQPSSSSPASAAGGINLEADSWTPDFSQPARFQLNSLLDLLDVQVSVPTADGISPSVNAGSGEVASGKNRLLASPFSSQSLAVSNYNEMLMDESTIENVASLVGRIDIQQAPRLVLEGVPGIDRSLADQIVQQRTGATATDLRGSILWLLTDGLVDLPRLKLLEPYLTCRSDVYATQAIGYRDALTPVYRCTAIIDARQRPARIIEHQAWHAWDRGFPIEQFAP